MKINASTTNSIQISARVPAFTVLLKNYKWYREQWPLMTCQSNI